MTQDEANAVAEKAAKEITGCNDHWTRACIATILRHLTPFVEQTVNTSSTKAEPRVWTAEMLADVKRRGAELYDWVCAQPDTGPVRPTEAEPQRMTVHLIQSTNAPVLWYANICEWKDDGNIPIPLIQIGGKWVPDLDEMRKDKPTRHAMEILHKREVTDLREQVERLTKACAAFGVEHSDGSRDTAYSDRIASLTCERDEAVSRAELAEAAQAAMQEVVLTVVNAFEGIGDVIRRQDEDEIIRRFAAAEKAMEAIALTPSKAAAELRARLSKYERVVEAIAPLVVIADAYDDNTLDDEARKFWGENDEFTHRNACEKIELYAGRGGKTLLTLADCMQARKALAALTPKEGT